MISMEEIEEDFEIIYGEGSWQDPEYETDKDAFIWEYNQVNRGECSK